MTGRVKLAALGLEETLWAMRTYPNPPLQSVGEGVAIGSEGSYLGLERFGDASEKHE